MLGAVAGLASSEGVEVEGYEAVSISYPRFERDLRSLVSGLERALEHDDVEPLAVERPVAQVGPDRAEARAARTGSGCASLRGEDLRRELVEAALARGIDERVEQRGPEPRCRALSRAT